MNSRYFSIAPSLFLLWFAASPPPPSVPNAIAREASVPQVFSHGDTLTIPSEFGSFVSDLALTPDDRLLAAAIITPDWYGPGTVKVWDLSENRLLYEFDNRSHHLATSPDGRWLVGAEDGGKPTIESIGVIEIWDANTGERRYRFNGNEMEFGGVNAIAISPDSQTLVSGSDFLQSYEDTSGSNLQVWNLQTGELQTTLDGHPGAVQSVAISPDGKILASGGGMQPIGNFGDSQIRLWDLETGEMLRTLEGHSDEVTALTISPDGRLLASGSQDSSIKLWNLQTGKLMQVLIGHTAAVESLEISRDGKRLISGSRDTTVRVWNLRTGERLQTVAEDAGTGFAISRKGGMLVTSERSDEPNENRIHLWRDR